MKRKLFTTLFCVSLLAASACDDTAEKVVCETQERFFPVPDPETEVEFAFNPALGETPESVATDFEGNLYVSLALTGEIAKLDPSRNRSTVAVLDLGFGQPCPGPFPGIMGALAIEPFSKTLYVPVNSCDLSKKGIYRVEQDGTSTMIASLPPEALGNGIGLRAGKVYVTDSGSSKIYRADTSGTGAPAEVWTDEPLLTDPDPFDIIPGSNGLQFFNGKMWVANAGAGSIVAIDLDFPKDGSGNIQPGPAEVVFGPPATNPKFETTSPGCDDFAFDIIGNLYCTTDPFQSVYSMNVYFGTTKLLFEVEDGLDGPTAAAFGRGYDRKTLYISNAQFPFFPPTGQGPSILSAQMPLGGYPLR